MTNTNLRSLSVVSLILLLILGACKKEEEIGPGLMGTWVRTSPFINGEGITGTHESKLIFASDNSFIWRRSSYGSYPGQAADQLSGWTEISGNLQITDSTLVFIPQKETWWDSFYGEMAPETLQGVTQPIFHQCSYSINGKELVLIYTDDPTEFAIITEEVFDKIR